MAGNEKRLGSLYALIGLLYIINSGVNLPGTLDDWLHKNHEMTYLMVGTIYFIIAILYLTSEKEHFASSNNNHKKNDNKRNHNNKCRRQHSSYKKYYGFLNFNNIFIFLVSILLLYSWGYMIFKHINTHQASNELI